MFLLAAVCVMGMFWKTKGRKERVLASELMRETGCNCSNLSEQRGRSQRSLCCSVCVAFADDAIASALM